MQRAPEIPGLTDFVQVGQGGNGVVYRATQGRLHRVVAVKLLTARLDDAAAARFAREGRALGAVSGHPNIVPVYSADTTADGVPYLVMLFCEHGSLAERLDRQGPMSVPAVLDLGVRMCGALQTAHDAGLLHRDIKPGNILFDAYDVPQLADFGQARLADANLTKTGDVVATPGYAAPEVLIGERATVRSDVYSLATTLMAALLGHGPFSRDSDENVAAVLLRVLQDPPPDLRPIGVPPQVAAELERAMDKTPGRRPMSAGELGRHLQQAQGALGLAQTPMIIAGGTGASPGYAVAAGLGEDRTRVVGRAPGGGTAALAGAGPGTGARPAPGSKRRTRVWIAVGVVVLLLAVAGVWIATQLTDSRTPTNPKAASELLIGSGDYGPGDWQATEDLNLLGSVFGTLPTSSEDADLASPSSLMTCLGLDPGTEVVSSKASAQYVDSSATDVDTEQDTATKYRYARSLAVVTTSASTAQRYVTAFASPQFDTCLDEVSTLGISVGQEQPLYSSQAKISVPGYQPDLPDGAHFQARQIEVPLQKAADSTGSSSGKTKQEGTRYVTVLAMSAGTSLEYVVMQGSRNDLGEEMMDAVVARFLDLATA
ncbi:serine/threonine-protein kinase [Cumulibacter manganitolerans]|uniref:serine/threonine-protein kinase n=1 Tax=Cumulibacter manganitolerans TaxID=1884992 RepID=UPI001885F5F1|nr:serine/threonine-protein kinase [Cumulibacter manganitolerans]